MERIINKESDKIGMCVATGPSLKPYLDNLIELSKSNDNYCFLSTNHYDSMFDLKAKYRVVANSVLTIDKEYKRFNSTNNTLLYADSVDTTNRYLVKNLLTIEYIPYDQRHYGTKTCKHKSKCCDHIIDGRLTIQEELQKYTKNNRHYGDGSTVALHMISFAILMGCKEIYLFGVDLNYNLGYVNPNFKNSGSFNPNINDILSDFKIIKESADNIGVKVYSTCKNSPINNVLPYKIFKN